MTQRRLSFGVRIALHAILLSSLALAGFAAMAWWLIRDAELQTLDNALGAQLQREILHPRSAEDWQQYQQVLAATLGNHQPADTLLAVDDRQSGLEYVSPDWPQALGRDTLLWPTAATDASAATEDTAPDALRGVDGEPADSNLDQPKPEENNPDERPPAAARQSGGEDPSAWQPLPSVPDLPAADDSRPLPAPRAAHAPAPEDRPPRPDGRASPMDDSASSDDDSSPPRWQPDRAEGQPRGPLPRRLLHRLQPDSNTEQDSAVQDSGADRQPGRHGQDREPSQNRQFSQNRQQWRDFREQFVARRQQLQQTQQALAAQKQALDEQQKALDARQRALQMNTDALLQARNGRRHAGANALAARISPVQWQTLTAGDERYRIAMIARPNMRIIAGVNLRVISAQMQPVKRAFLIAIALATLLVALGAGVLSHRALAASAQTDRGGAQFECQRAGSADGSGGRRS